MQRYMTRSPLCALMSGLWLLACGAAPEAELGPSEEPLGTQEAAVCSGLSVSQLDITDISSEGGELAGFGSWAVSLFSNAIRLEYYVDGVLHSSDERPGNSSSWYFSTRGLGCGWHNVVVKAYPMVIDSNGNRTTCWSNPRTTSTSVLDYCSPTASLSCIRGYSSVVSCSGSANLGTGSYTPYWYDSRTGSWYEGGWDNGFTQCAPPGYGQSTGWLTIGFKVRDSQGVFSNAQYDYFECSVGGYNEF